jgi:membrane-bound lytic murein transglycosylase D
MRIAWLIAAAGLACASLPAQDNSMDLEGLLEEGWQWAQDNLDERLLGALGEVDQDKTRQVFRALQQRLQGEYVADLAALKDAAASLLPVLEGRPETRPYAAWLKTRLDYFEVASEFRLTIPAPPVEPGQPPKPAPNPEAPAQRKAWEKQLKKRPAPPASQTLAGRLKPLFKARQVPAELVWLAEVESSFDPSARSPAGAAGLYQLMPRTAQWLGLSLHPTDERLDAEKSAGAAASYLRYLHRQFKDWRLALAAYNAGEGTVSNLLARRKARTFDEVARYLPAETQMYVPKVEAVLSRREGVKLASLPGPGA